MTPKDSYRCVPVPSWFVKYLPHDRPYTELEAWFSVRVDYRSKKKDVTILGYSRLWGWSREKVRDFLYRMGFEIKYPRDTKIFRKQGGYLQKIHKKPNNIQRLKVEKDIKHNKIHYNPKNVGHLESEADICSAPTVPDGTDTVAQQGPLFEDRGPAAANDGNTVAWHGEHFPKKAKVPVFTDGMQAKLKAPAV